MPQHRNEGAAAQRGEEILRLVGAMGFDAFEGAAPIGPGVGESHAASNRLRRRRLVDSDGVADQMQLPRDRGRQLVDAKHQDRGFVAHRAILVK